METSKEITGLASWFDAAFVGQDAEVILSTAPHSALTHWYQVWNAWNNMITRVVFVRLPRIELWLWLQVRCLLRRPLLVMAGERITGHLRMKINRIQSYDIHIEV